MSKFDQKLTRKNLFIYKEQDLPFLKLSELKAQKGDGPFTIKALWIAKPQSTKFEAHPVVVIEGFNIDLPPHKLQDVEDMLQDQETIDQINAGECGFIITEYTNNFGKFNGIEWCKMELSEV